MTAAPPLLVLAAGGKPRLRRARFPVPKESVLHFAVAKLLREHCLWEWTHMPAGEHRDIRTAAKLKQLGLRKGWADFLLIAPSGVLHCLELKRPGEDLTQDQEIFRIKCIACHVPYEVAWTMDQALLAFERWGCLRVQFPARVIDG